MKKHIFVIVLLCISTLISADPVKIFLRSGRTIVGEIVAQNTDIVVLKDTKGRSFQLPAGDIEHIGSISEPDPEQKQTTIQEQSVQPVAPPEQEQPVQAIAEQEQEQPTQPVTPPEQTTPQPTVRPIAQTTVYTIDQQAQSSYNLAKAALFSGVYVFSHSQPAQPYTILGEVTHNNKNAGNKTVYYAEMRNDLVAQAIMANREVQGVIIRGKNATLIKFDSDTPNKDLALVDKVRGILIFLDSEPLRQYDYIKTKKVIIAEDTDKTIDNLARKANNANKGVQAIIIRSGEQYIERADLVRFNRW